MGLGGEQRLHPTSGDTQGLVLTAALEGCHLRYKVCCAPSGTEGSRSFHAQYNLCYVLL